MQYKNDNALKKIKILVLSSAYPDTLSCGFRLLLTRIIEGLYLHSHTIDIVAFGDVHALHDRKSNLIEPFCNQIIIVDKPYVPPWKSPRRWLSIFHDPDTATLACSSVQFSSRVKRLVDADSYDIVIYVGYGMMQYRKMTRDLPGVAMPIDCLSLALQREPCQGFFNRLRLAIQSYKVRRVENNYDQFNTSFFVAKADADYAKRFSPAANIVWHPNGVDYKFFSPSEEPPFPKTIGFHGSMSFGPNVEAALWFIEQIWPFIKLHNPNARLFLIGINPDIKLIEKSNQDTNIILTGYVDDIRPYLQRVSVYIAPMRSGGGIKNKILEAMSMHKPIVATALAMEGIDKANVNEHFVEANTADEFIYAINKLWKNNSDSTRIGNAASKLVKEHYSWESLQEFCEKMLYKTVNPT